MIRPRHISEAATESTSCGKAWDKYEPTFSTKISTVKPTGSITLLVVAFLLNTDMYGIIVEGQRSHFPSAISCEP